MWFSLDILVKCVQTCWIQIEYSLNPQPWGIKQNFFLGWLLAWMFLGVNLASRGTIVNWNAVRVSLDLSVMANARVLTMQPVTRRTVHVTASQDGLVSIATIPAPLGTTARTVSQSASVRMGLLVTQSMATVHAWMSGKGRSVISVSINTLHVTCQGVYMSQLDSEIRIFNLVIVFVFMFLVEPLTCNTSDGVTSMCYCCAMHCFITKLRRPVSHVCFSMHLSLFLKIPSCVTYLTQQCT